MPNQITSGQAGDPRNVDHWLHIDDFSPGVYDGTYISDSEAIINAPIGAANAEDTWCCASLPAGGLGPLPALTNVFTYPFGFPGALTQWNTVGFIINPGLANVDDEAIIILEGDDGTSHYVTGWSQVAQTASTNNILNSVSGTVPGFFGAPYPVWTRMSDGGAGNPPPRLVFPSAVSTDANGNSGHLYVYPPLDAPTTFTVQDLITPGSSTTGQTIAYGSRILVLAGIEYQWPAGGGVGTNENINFTDPPQSGTYGDQMTILGAEIPWGYGAWGSVSVGELMLIKKYGGGIALYGDIFEPSSVIELPGIQPTGDFVGRAASTQQGLVYCVENMGAWIWNGGNNSQKISTQLRDDFFDTRPTVLQNSSNNYGFCVEHWQDWLLFSNNYMFNPDTGGWWVLYPNAHNGDSNVVGRTIWWWSPGRFGNQMYAAPLSFTNSDTEWYYRFDNTVPTKHWQWQSLPIHVVPNATRVIDVVQVELRASDPTGSNTAEVTIQIGFDVQTTSAPIGVDPTLFRFNYGAGSLGIEDIIVRLNGDNAGSGFAPIIHSLDIGYKTRALKGSDN